MNKLTEQEMNNISGGGFGLWAGIGAAVTFLIGFFDGWMNPNKCNG